MRRRVDGVPRALQIYCCMAGEYCDQQQAGSQRDCGKEPPTAGFGDGSAGLQRTDLTQDLLLHRIGEYHAGQTGIQGVNDVVTHGRDTILSVLIATYFWRD